MVEVAQSSTSTDPIHGVRHLHLMSRLRNCPKGLKQWLCFNLLTSKPLERYNF